MERDPYYELIELFQSTPSAWRETQGRPAIYRRSFISIHSLRMEGDFTTVIAFYFGTHFNPLPPHGGRQNDLTIVNTALVISIHSLRMEGDLSLFSKHFTNIHISIHSLRMEGDAGVVVTLIGFCISIHSLRMEGDVRIPTTTARVLLISIHSLRMEGDSDIEEMIRHEKYFNPLPPHGGRRTIGNLDANCGRFQSTPSAWRETATCTRVLHILSRFQSTPSAWRETGKLCAIIMPIVFQSTPSAWRETVFENCNRCGVRNFNPLPPHGGRPPGQ